MVLQIQKEKAEKRSQIEEISRADGQRECSVPLPAHSFKY